MKNAPDVDDAIPGLIADQVGETGDRPRPKTIESERGAHKGRAGFRRMSETVIGLGQGIDEPIRDFLARLHGVIVHRLLDIACGSEPRRNREDHLAAC